MARAAKTATIETYVLSIFLQRVINPNSDHRRSCGSSLTSLEADADAVAARIVSPLRTIFGRLLIGSSSFAFASAGPVEGGAV